MEKASTFLYARQSEEARRREEELRQEMPTTVLVRKVADWQEVKLEDEQADRLGMWVHYGFGAAGGPVAVVLAKTTPIGPLGGRTGGGDRHVPVRRRGDQLRAGRGRSDRRSPRLIKRG
jgi:hypothetical protein